ncbi:MAG: hypothetical protein Kow0010_24360 [Dehalococcoidia bacterium]
MVKRTALDPLTLVYHELRAPLGLVATAAYSAIEEAGNEAVRERCEAIARSAERMLRTASQVLAVAAAAESRDEPGDFVPAEVITALTADLDALDVGVEVRTTPAADGTAVHGSRDRFEALVQSILMNAVDHSDPGATVSVAVEANDDTVAVTVANPLPSCRRHRGLSLGSYLCERLAEGLGARYRAGAEDDRFVASIELPR